MELRSTFGDSYGIDFTQEKIVVNAYLKGSIAGGTGTEKHSEVSGDSLISMLRFYEVGNPVELEDRAKEFSQEEIDGFLKRVTEHETITFLWSETDWSDEK